MTKNEFMKLINDIPKSNNPSPISTYGSVSVEDICNAIDRLNKVPTYDELLKENEKLNHYKLLYQKVKDRNDEAIEYLKDREEDNECCSVCSVMSDRLLEILKGNNE